MYEFLLINLLYLFILGTLFWSISAMFSSTNSIISAFPSVFPTSIFL